MRIPFGGSELILEHGEDGGYALSAPSAIARTPLFVDPIERPESYPPQLPFIAGEVVTIDSSEGHSTMLWWAPGDPVRVLGELHDLCVADGWVPENERELPEQNWIQRAYKKSDLHRLILKSDGAITLVDRELGGLSEGSACRLKTDEPQVAVRARGRIRGIS